jgi:hypothetical protein
MTNRPIGGWRGWRRGIHGIVTRQQLFALGLGRGAVHARVRNGRLYAVHAGVYVVGHTARAPLALEMAAVLACGEGAAISHRSAAALWALATHAATAQVEVTIPGTRAPRRPGIRVYTTRSLAAEDLRLIDAVPVTSPARTLLDIARFLTVESLEATVADASRRGLVKRRELADQVERNPRRPGVSTLRALLAQGEPAFTRSVAERKLLRLIRDAHLPSPLVNARVGQYEVDFLWPRERVVVEVDGYTSGTRIEPHSSAIACAMPNYRRSATG